MAVNEAQAHNAATRRRLTEVGEERAGTEIDLLALLYRLLERVKFIIFAALLGTLLAGVYTYMLVTPMYTATAKLYVLNTNDSALNLSDLQIGTYLAADYQEVFTNWHVHEMVRKNLGLPYGYNQMSTMVTVNNPNNTRILYIRVKSSDPDEARAMANEYAKVAQEFIASTMETQKPNVFEEALRPSAPSSPNKSRNLILGFLLGAIIAGGVITLQFVTDDRIRTSDDIEKHLGMPMLGMMPVQKPGAGKTGKGRQYMRYARNPRKGDEKQ